MVDSQLKLRNITMDLIPLDDKIQIFHDRMANPTVGWIVDLRLLILTSKLQPNCR